MSAEEYEAIGRGTVKLLAGAFYLAMVAGSVWVLGDIGRSSQQGAGGLLSWVLLSWLLLFPLIMGGSAVYGLWRLITGRFD